MTYRGALDSVSASSISGERASENASNSAGFWLVRALSERADEGSGRNTADALPDEAQYCEATGPGRCRKLARTLRSERRRRVVMAVRKLAMIEDAPASRANPLEGESLRSAVELSELCLRLRPITPPRGVLRFT